MLIPTNSFYILYKILIETLVDLATLQPKVKQFIFTHVYNVIKNKTCFYVYKLLVPASPFNEAC